MKLLIIGGTWLLGRAIADVALNAGHEIRLFNRGQFDPNEYPALELARGGRDSDLDLLDGHSWDIVIDICG